VHRLLSFLAGAVFAMMVSTSTSTAQTTDVEIVQTTNADILEAECHAQLDLGDSGCACIGDRADELLDDDQQALVVAALTGDDETRDELRADMSAEDMAEAIDFMNDTPGICAAQ
jgi:hypothetical protein